MICSSKIVISILRWPSRLLDRPKDGSEGAISPSQKGPWVRDARSSWGLITCVLLTVVAGTAFGQVTTATLNASPTSTPVGTPVTTTISVQAPGITPLGGEVALFANGAEIDSSDGTFASNLFFPSEGVGPLGFGVYGGTLTANSATDPLGGQTASTYHYDGRTDGYLETQLSQSSPLQVVPGQIYTFSVWLRSPGGNFHTYIGIENGSATSAYNYIQVRVRPFWQRFQVSATVGSGGTTLIIGGWSTTNIAPGDLQVWGVQFEQAPTAGPYIQTTTGPVQTVGNIPDPALATNLFVPSEDLGASAFGVLGGSLTPDVAASPTGTQTASVYHFSDVATSGTDSYLQTELAQNPVPFTLMYDEPYTFSVWLRSHTGAVYHPMIGIDDGPTATLAYVYVPVEVTSTWTRFQVSAVIDGQYATLVIGGWGTLSSIPGGGDIEVWGAQFEHSVQAGPYVQTTTGPASIMVFTDTTSGLPIGSNILSASFYANAPYLDSLTAPQTVVVTGPSQATPSLYTTCQMGTTANTAVCTSSLPSTATGSVSFSLDGALWSSGQIGGGTATGSGSIAGVQPGTHSIYVSYAGDSIFTGAFDSVDLIIPADSGTPVVLGTPIYSYSIPSNGFDGAGNIVAYSDSVNGNWTATYDNLSRLTQATAQVGTSATQYLCWKYDSFGNRLGQDVETSPCDPASIPALTSAPNNQVAPPGFSYDAAGNLQTDTANSYLYDGARKICAVRRSIAGTVMMEGYIYDAEGTRVAKGTLTSFSCDNTINGFTVSETSWVDPVGNVSLIVSGSASRTNYYADASLVATADARGTHYHLGDWLETRRMQTDTVGNVEATFMSRPFGDTDQINSDPADATSEHFTSKQRDAESGLDYFKARYYGSSTGRFLSPDPLLSSGSPNNPQTWNRYAYVMNNPLVHTDPTGMYTCGSSDNAKACADFESALALARLSITNMMNSGDTSGAMAVASATSNYGAAGQDIVNGREVVVSFVNLGADGLAGTESDGGRMKDGTPIAKVTVNLDSNLVKDTQLLGILAVHEGTHISQPGANTLFGQFRNEVAAYTAGTALARSYGVSTDAEFPTLRGQPIDTMWEKGWKLPDDQAKSQNGIAGAAFHDAVALCKANSSICKGNVSEY